MNKVCSSCNIEKDESEFYKNKTGLQSNCKQCHRECVKRYEKSERGKKRIRQIRGSQEYWDNPSIKYSRAKASVKRKGGELLMTMEEYLNISSKPCHYCNGTLNNEKNRGLGLDRIDNSKTYELSNVLPCCGFCNKTRGDRLTVLEMELVAQFLIDLRKNSALSNII